MTVSVPLEHGRRCHNRRQLTFPGLKDSDMSARDTVPRPDASRDLDATQRMNLSELPEDDQKTVVVPGEQRTVVQPTTIDNSKSVASSDEERQRRRAEREQSLGTKPKTDEAIDEQATAPQAPAKRTTDKFLGSAGLFVLRIVTAGIIGLHGFAKALDITAVQAMLSNTVIPEPVIMSYVLTAGEVAIALALVFGLLTRLAGLGLAAIGIGALVFVQWIGNPFNGNALVGELELLLAGVGLLFVCLGAGGWSIDAAFRRRRAAA
jgi:putative oxidoreductase